MEYLDTKTKKKMLKGCMVASVIFAAIMFISLLVAIFSDGDDKNTKTNEEKEKTGIRSTKSPEELKKELKERLEREIQSIDEGIDFSDYHNDDKMTSLKIEIALFGMWGKIIVDGEMSKDAEIKKLSAELKAKAANIQIKEFPILRKRYGEISNELMWEQDINISTNGTGNKYINITGRIFAANKNKQEFQDEISEVLKIFRFNECRYRWHKEADEYTYYTIYEGKDSDIVMFE